MKSRTMIDLIALILVIIGGLNWGLIGLFNFDLVAALFGYLTPLSKIVYSVVGFAAIYCIYYIIKTKAD